MTLQVGCIKESPTRCKTLGFEITQKMFYMKLDNNHVYESLFTKLRKSFHLGHFLLI